MHVRGRARAATKFVADYTELGLSVVVRIREQHAVKAKMAIVGSGNISTDLLYKLCDQVAGAALDGGHRPGERWPRAAKAGLETTHEGWTGCWRSPGKPGLVFGQPAYLHCTGTPGAQNAEAGITPAAVGPAVIPPANLRREAPGRAPNVQHDHLRGRAAIPIVYAVSRIVEIALRRIVASVAFRFQRDRAPTSTRVHQDRIGSRPSAKPRQQGDHHLRSRRPANR